MFRLFPILFAGIKYVEKTDVDMVFDFLNLFYFEDIVVFMLKAFCYSVLFVIPYAMLRMAISLWRGT